MSEPPVANAPLPVPDEINFIPQAHSRHPRYRTLDGWFDRNLRPMLLIGAAIVLQVLCILSFHTSDRQQKEPSSPETPTLVDHVISETEIQELAEKSIFPLFHLALIGLGFLVSLVMIVSNFTSRTAEQSWLTPYISKFSIRALPALRILDLVAILAVFLTSAYIVSTLLLLLFKTHVESAIRRERLQEINMPLSLIVIVLASTSALLATVWLARERGNGIHGSHGVWPFWQSSKHVQQTSVWHDIGLGIKTYFLTFWIVLVANMINAQCVKILGLKEDHHPIVDTIQTNPSWIVAVSLIGMAVLSAPFFEELIFRGVLYNVLRRYLGGLAGAIAAAFIFSISHGIGSQILGLWVLGLIMTWLYERTGRLVASMTFHCINNAMAMASLFSMMQS